MHIVEKRFKKDSNLAFNFSDAQIHAAVEHFYNIRDLNLKKKPSTAEFLSWLYILNTMNLDITNLTKELSVTYTVLAKNSDDLNMMISFLKNNI